MKYLKIYYYSHKLQRVEKDQIYEIVRGKTEDPDQFASFEAS